MGPELRPKCKTGKFCIKSSRKKGQNEKIIRVILDSGLDGDLMFHKEGTTKIYPYYPIKTILLEVIHANKLEQNKNFQHDTCGVTAEAALLEAGPELCPKCKTGKFRIKTSRKKLPKRKSI